MSVSVCKAQRAGVIFVSRPRFQQHVHDGSNHFGVAAERLARPFFGDVRGSQVGVPCQASEAVQVRGRHVIAVPVEIQPGIRYAHKASHRPVECLSRRQRLHRRTGALCPQIEIQSCFPLRYKKHQVPRLSHIFLRDL